MRNYEFGIMIRSLKTISLLAMVFLTVQPAIASQIKNLDVPFTVQAPDGWYAPFDEACEEAATVMLDFYYNGKNLSGREKEQILQVVELENKVFGFNKDTNAAQMANIINNFFPFEADIISEPTLEQIKNEINYARPVLVPVYGRGLDNPHFQGDGPIYHVVIIKGYNDSTQEFITNEPGTNYGHNWQYGYDDLMEAMHDFNFGQTIYGDKVAIFTHADLRHSGLSDGDNDDLSKIDEIKIGTRLKSADSDGDGQLDGHEASPLINNNLYENKLLRSFDNPRVYLIESNYKKHIKSAEQLFALGFDWADIIRVDQYILDKIP